MAGRDVERRQLRGDERQAEGALLTEFGRGGHHVGPLREQPCHFLTGSQMRTAQRGQPAGRLVQRLPGSYRTHGHRQPTTRRRGEMCTGGRDAVEAESHCQLS